LFLSISIVKLNSIKECYDYPLIRSISSW